MLLSDAKFVDPVKKTKKKPASILEDKSVSHIQRLEVCLHLQLDNWQCRGKELKVVKLRYKMYFKKCTLA